MILPKLGGKFTSKSSFKKAKEAIKGNLVNVVELYYTKKFTDIGVLKSYLSSEVKGRISSRL